MKKLFLVLTIGLLALAFRFTETINFVTPATWPKPHYDFKKNPLSKNKIELGRALFYETALSRNNTISCSSCHLQYTAFTHVDHALSHGIEDKIGTRNSPALMNLAWQKQFMWDGAINHLDMQALAPISNPLEMDENIVKVTLKLQSTILYPKLFLKAFGDSVITGQHLLQALSQFMLTLVSCNSKYDSVVRHQAKFNEQEEKGYQLFQKHCNSCHTEPLFTNQKFMNNGLALDSTLNDTGRYGLTKNPNDSLCFKVPTLRNIEFSHPYMHDGRIKRLGEVLNHYTRPASKSKTLAKELQNPITLSSAEKVELTAFLLSLTDKSFLFNPRYSYPKEIFLKQAKE